MREGKGGQSVVKDQLVEELEEEVVRCHDILRFLVQDAEDFCWSLEGLKHQGKRSNFGLYLHGSHKERSQVDTETRPGQSFCIVCGDGIVGDLEKVAQQLDLYISELSQRLTGQQWELESSRKVLHFFLCNLD